MLNPILREKIAFAEIRMLYDSKIAMTNATFKKELKKHIQDIRKKFGKNEQDLLEQRQKNYGKEVGGWYRSQIQEAERKLFDSGKTIPNEFQGQWRSIEFELIFNNERALQEFVGLTRFSSFANYITIKNDGSIKLKEGDREGIPREVVVNYRTGQEDIVRKVSRYLRGRAYVNNTCGTHVHFDLRNADENTATLYANRIVRCIQALKTLLPKSRRDNKFCKEAVNTFKDRGRPEDRYSFVNLLSYNKYRTLEIRGHSGTIIASKILNWIKICETIMLDRIACKSKEITTPEQLIKVYKLDKENPDLMKYIMERFEQFNDKPGKHPADEGEIVVPPVEVSSSLPIITTITAKPPKMAWAAPRFEFSVEAVAQAAAAPMPSYAPLCGNPSCTEPACRPADVVVDVGENDEEDSLP